MCWTLSTHHARPGQARRLPDVMSYMAKYDRSSLDVTYEWALSLDVVSKRTQNLGMQDGPVYVDHKDMQKENIGTPSKGSKLSKCVGKFVVLVQKKMWRDMLYEVE